MFDYTEPCPYLPDRSATLQGFFAPSLHPSVYRDLLDHSFRRSGHFFYRPHCDACDQCVPIRIPLSTFSPSRSQRRTLKRNASVIVNVASPSLTDEKAHLYTQYQLHKHGRSDNDLAPLREFLYTPVVPTLEFTYRDPGGKLIAVGICDLFADALSSVYAYYDPTLPRRSLGTFTALCEIDYALRQSLAYYYLGYWVKECPAMRYKASYRPFELLDAFGHWHNQSPGSTDFPAETNALT